MKIVVLMGGTSSEREVSLSSGKNIAEALKRNGHDVLLLDTVLPIGQLQESIPVTVKEIEQGDENLLHLLIEPEIRSADFIFSALHGGSGENGIVQGILQILGYQFNGSSAEGCAIAMDKVVSKMIFEKNGIPTPKWLYFERIGGFDYAETIDKIARKFQLPLVIKPGHEGSTVGLTIVKKHEQIKAAINKALKYNSVFLVEEYIPGRELTVAVLGKRALPVVEIRPKHGIYDYECKYTSGMSEYIVPADIGDNLAEEIQDLTINAFNLLRCSGYGRMDLRLCEDNKPCFLEMNTLPGMTSTSLVPKAAKAVGLSFEQLLEEIIRIGMGDNE
ncbi:D-alanine--D-alanine ligase [bacterium]|nr:D-alanine--D-alanine ligase [bacterium]MBU1064913.1 D-alanine--D-alanine ligase [bacterium]MBU1634157.1 D-alanine--D-alanine ligase [bacterium]MBU1874256.1 D-alanine--D-alanine ligase [bacterium]